jgi:hypothetical protein
MGKRNVKDQNGKASVLEEMKIPTQVKLVGLWATVMFMYIYVDIIGFYKPGLIAEIMTGKVWVFDIDQMWMLSMLMLMTIPILMVFLSLALPAKANRYANIVIGAFHICLAFVTAMGEIQASYLFGSIVEVILLCLIVWIAWKWPRVTRNNEVGN